MIIWLENPEQYKYLRESYVMRGSRRGFKKGVKLDLSNFYKLIGYEVAQREDKCHFYYRILWLKKHDLGCPDVAKGLYGDGRLPAEGKVVEDLLKESLEKKEARCIECKQFNNSELCFRRGLNQSTKKVVEICTNFAPVDKKYPS
jgi:hypothetical protein